MRLRDFMPGFLLLMIVSPLIAQQGYRGSIIFTEFLANPNAVTDAKGEWIEIYNTTDTAITIKGWILRDSDTDMHVITDSLVIDPLSYLLLGRNEEISTNGGVRLDYKYSGFILNNVADELILMKENELIDSVSYVSGIENGKSMCLSSLKLNAVMNDSLQNWCTEAFIFGQGDLGSPGKQNISCTWETGDVIITEMMIDPVKVFDVDGEWFELYNTAPYPLNLKGMSLEDHDEDQHSIDQDLGIGSGEFLVLARNPDSLLNGGVPADYSYDGILMSNEIDELILYMGSKMIDSVAYDRSIFPMSQARSINLDPEYFSYQTNDNPFSWCRSSQVYGLGDRGSPGLPNETCGALPVILEYFTARVKETGIELSWGTTFEENHRYFHILRKRKDHEYEQIGEITSTGAFPEGSHYRITDLKPNTGINFYQLVQEDADGTRETLGVIRILFKDPDLTIFPNPFRDQVTVRSQKLPEIIEILDHHGQLIRSETNIRTIKLSRFSPGIYFIRLMIGGKVQAHKIIKD